MHVAKSRRVHSEMSRATVGRRRRYIVLPSSTAGPSLNVGPHFEEGVAGFGRSLQRRASAVIFGLCVSIGTVPNGHFNL